MQGLLFLYKMCMNIKLGIGNTELGNEKYIVVMQGPLFMEKMCMNIKAGNLEVITKWGNYPCVMQGPLLLEKSALIKHYYIGTEKWELKT